MDDPDIPAKFDAHKAETLDEHIAALTDGDGPHWRSIAALTMRAVEAAPILRRELDKAAAGSGLTRDEKGRLFFAVHILGGARDEASLAPMLRMLHRPSGWLQDTFGITLTATFSQIIAGMFDGDADALFDAICDQFIDEYIRDSLMTAATFLAWNGRIPRERYKQFVCRFYEERLAEDGEYVWGAWVDAITFLGWRDMMWRVDRACVDGRVPHPDEDYGFYLENLEAAERRPFDRERLAAHGMAYIDDVVETLRTLPAQGAVDEDQTNAQPNPFESAINPFRYVGRNEPCPCGSGKKAKKCCLN